MRLVRTRMVAVLLTATCVQCGGQPVSGPTELFPPPPGPIPPAPPLPSPAPIPPSPPEVFVGAGDIGFCGAGGNPESTARLLDAIGGTVFTLGDNAYGSGTAREFRDCYDRSWGRHKIRTRPVPGNHDYETAGAVPYFEYFGANAGPPGLGYYSFELGSWHAVALNSNIPVGAGSIQGAWLRADLASSRTTCTLAYWHHPFFSSGPHGSSGEMRDFWRMLYDAGADIVLSGHDHLYERFAPQDPDGLIDPARGIRQFTVGTGGAPLYPFIAVRPNSQVRIGAFGVLRLTLNAESYAWSFIPVSGAGDSGTGTCH